MFFRVTAQSMNAQAIQFSQRLNFNLANYQRDLATGARIHRPSDDPIAFAKSNLLQARQTELQAESFTVKDASAKLNFAVSELLEANQLITTAKTLTLEGIQSISPSERQALAIEVDSLLDRMKTIALSKHAGRFIFGGTRTDVPPFEFEQPALDGRLISVNYQGSTDSSRAYISQSVTIDTLFSGDQIFGSSQRQPTRFFGNTGASAGVGTDNMVGQAKLQVRHVASTYQGGSGIQAAANSSGRDTILGPMGQNSIQVVDTSGDGSAGFVSLNGGPPVAFTNADTSLEVVAGNGQRVFVDTTSITPGFNDVVSIETSGTLSIDGGLSTTPIDYSATQRVFDSASGRFVHVNSEGIRRVGDENLEFPGTLNVFQVLHGLAEDLRGNREFDGAGSAAALDRRLGDLERISEQVLDFVGIKSASLSSLSRLEQRIDELELQTTIQMNEVRATDIPSTILRMQQDQLLLETNYSITARLLSTQLINFLR